MDYLSKMRKIENEIIAWRRDFHRNPELGFQEFRSADIIATKLSRWGYEVKTDVAETGVIGLMEGDQPGKNILVRLDMDALPILEENNCDYASINQGVMHACGHDGHMSIGLASAFTLSEQKHHLCGSVKFVFQPAEEGLGGAKRMLQEGVLSNPEPDLILGLHIINDLPIGTIAVTDGPIATSHDSLTCTIQGKGGHGAVPHLAVDPVVATAQIIMGLQTISSRNISPLSTGVVSVTTVQASGASNIIPDKVIIKGTIRAFEQETQELMHLRIKEIIEQTAQAMQCNANVHIENVNPALFNDPDIAKIVRESAKVIVGEMNIVTDYRTTGSDDIAYFTESVPGCYFYIGSKNPQKGMVLPVHHPKYDYDEHALVYGSAVLSEAIDRFVLD